MDGKENRGPWVKSRRGCISLTVWRRDRVLPLRHGFDTERERSEERVCLQHSTWDWTRREWKRQSVWFRADELRDLGNAFDALVAERVRVGLD